MRPTLQLRQLLARPGVADALPAAIRAARQALATLKQTGGIAAVAHEVPSFEQFSDLLGMSEVQQLEARYGVDAGFRARY